MELTDNDIDRLSKQLKDKQAQASLDELSMRLRLDPDDARLCYLASEAYLALNRPGLALPLAQKAVSLEPERAGCWNHLGRALDALHLWEPAEKAFRHAIRLDGENVLFHANLSTVLTNAGQAEDAYEQCCYVLDLDPSNRQARNNRGMAGLALGKRGAWDDYEAGVSYTPHRLERYYAGEPRWEGASGETVVFYGEQGLGDEIAFAAYLRPALARTTGILDVDARLAPLFRRSFPEAQAVHGTRHGSADWVTPEQVIDGRCIFGSLGRFAPPYDGLPYLAPDEERCIAVRALLDSLPGLKVGLAWTGGTLESRGAARSLNLEQLTPILSVPGCSFISLEYHTAGDEQAKAAGIKVWPWLTQTRDYDDTAALVTELDLVVAVPTAVVHLAGALGTTCLAMVQDSPSWAFGVGGPAMSASLRPKSIRCLRQQGRGWGPVIREAADEVEKMVANRS